MYYLAMGHGYSRFNFFIIKKIDYLTDCYARLTYALKQDIY